MDDTMRDDLNAAIDAVDDGNDEELSSTDTAINEVSADVGSDDTDVDTTDVDTTDTLQAAQDTDVLADGESADMVDSAKLKAPAGWAPQHREQWSKIPQELQEHITARETEMTDNIANTSTARSTHDRMQALGGSYASIMAAEGVTDPVQAAEGLFQTVSQLRMGNAEQKAQTIAQLINHYGVDITTLDNTLTGQQAPDSQSSELERRLEEKMQPLNQMLQLLEQGKAEQASQNQTNAEKEIKAFASNGGEFLADVRNDMADMIDHAYAQGRQMSLQDAYNKAVAMNPQISRILEQRKLMSANNNVQKKREAASSLNGRRSGVTSASSTSNSLRDDLMSAFEAYQ